MRKRIISKRDTFEKIAWDLEAEKNEKMGTTALVDYTSKARNLPTTKEYKEWIGEKQKQNPLIGKYVSRAPEYETDAELGEQKQMDEEKAKSEIGKYVNECMEAKADIDGMETPLIDMCVIENSARFILSNRIPYDIENCIKSELKQYHEDDSYETTLDIMDIVKAVKEKMVLEGFAFDLIGKADGR